MRFLIEVTLKTVVRDDKGISGFMKHLRRTE